jgi:hypothetical protein
VEKNVDKKQKTQKVKSKAAVTVEAKKHLASVRVIQRNLVYIIGLPANLCNESILERREYFGQYGKVLKVSVSRPTGAPSQQAPTNNSISVYVYVNLMPHVYDVSLMDKHDLLFQVIRYILPYVQVVFSSYALLYFPSLEHLSIGDLLLRNYMLKYR